METCFLTQPVDIAKVWGIFADNLYINIRNIEWQELLNHKLVQEE